MKIIVSSLNKTKINAVRAVFPDASVIGVDFPSNVSKQPMTDEVTRQGALNRSKNAHRAHPEAITIGLEGGIMFLDNALYLTNWGALTLPSKQTFTAAGARISLPISFKEKLVAGIELSDIMDEYAQQNDIRNAAGAIGIFTSGFVSRTDLFVHVVTLLKGQMSYNK